MDTGKAIEITKKYINFLKDKYDIRNVILFGSFAKGTFHEDSDIDVAIVINHLTDRIDTQIELMKLRRRIDLRIEPHPFNQADFSNSDPMVNEILKHGISIGLEH